MKPLLGFLQGVFPDRIRGWAFDPNDPDQHLSIEIRVKGQVIASASAEQKFRDLEQKKIGKGDHGFLLHLEPSVAAEDLAGIEVIAMSSSGQTRILGRSETPGEQRSSAGAEMPVPEPSGAAPETVPEPASTATKPKRQSQPHQPVRKPDFRAQDADARPVFVLGSARSGTSAMVGAIIQTGRYEAYYEGHFLTLALRLDQTAQTFYARAVRDAAPGMNTLVAHVELQSVRDCIHAGFIEMMRATFSGIYWLDKTPGPEMIKAAPLMHRIWPNARFIFMRRHPVDNIESRRRKFPTIAFADHCKLWADSMLAWHGVRDDMAGCSLEIDQVEMARNPDQITALVAGFLNLDDPQTARMHQAMSKGRPQKTGSDPTDHVTLADVDWSDAERAIFSSVCAEPARLFGY